MGRKFSSSKFFKEGLRDERLSAEAKDRAIRVGRSVSEWIDTMAKFSLEGDSIKGRVSIDHNVYVEWVYKRHENRILSKKIIFK